MYAGNLKTDVLQPCITVALRVTIDVKFNCFNIPRLFLEKSQNQC